MRMLMLGSKLGAIKWMSCSRIMNLNWELLLIKSRWKTQSPKVGGLGLSSENSSGWFLFLNVQKMAISLEDCLIRLVGDDDWRGVLDAGKQFSVEEKSKFLWAWPSADCFQWLKCILVEQQIGSILSIGCGSGLLEWLIHKTAGVKVTGIELDKSWWKSAYSPTTFIDLKFTDQQITSKFLKQCIGTDTNQFALLFCYFNAREAFQQYVRAYHGDCIIIVGPSSEQHIVTDPNPLNPKFEINEWTLLDCRHFNDQFSNCMSIYKKIKSNEPSQT